MKLLQEKKDEYFEKFLPSWLGQVERWDAIDFTVRYSLHVYNGKSAKTFFKEKFTRYELILNGITGDMLDYEPTRFGTFLSKEGWKHLFLNYYNSMITICSFIGKDEDIKEERLQDWRKIMSRMLPRLVDVIDEIESFYLRYKIPPPVPKDIEDVYHNCKFSKYKMPKEFRLNVRKKSK